MSDFVVDVLKSIVSNVNALNLNRESLVDKIKYDLNEDINDYEISPIIERSIYCEIINELSNGMLLLTDYGKELIVDFSLDIDDFWSNHILRESSEILQSQETLFKKAHHETIISLTKSYNEYSVHLRKYLKSLLMSMNPYNFEALVIQILVLINEAPYGEVTKKSGDGGIDGFLYKTPLKHGEIPIQIKRFSDNNLVGEQEIRDFIGAWSEKHNNGAYFVTTSDFTNKAKLKSENRGITLIDGNQLVDLMINYQIGLQPYNNLNFCLTPSLEVFD